MQHISAMLKAENKSIGFVPTMGYLHKGHLSLVEKSQKQTDVTVVSIFVNPTQFAPNEDLNKYPRDIERDKNFLSKLGVDYLFQPAVEEIYHENFQTFVNVEKITKTLEGEFRPAHFKGVTSIVSILFNSVMPDYAFFGQKDAQQAAAIKQMVSDLKFNVKIIVSPIVREPDGLALSSRNIYLSGKERKDALVLSQSLKLASILIKDGERNTELIISKMNEIINSVNTSKLDYIKIVEADSFIASERLIKNKSYYILVACRIGSTRLIDNTFLKIK